MRAVPKPRWRAAALAPPPLPLAVLIAALAVHRLPLLPPGWASAVLLGVGLAGMVLGRTPGRAWLRFAALLLAASGWAMLRADWALAERISPAQEGVDFLVQGHVAGMPQSVERGSRFLFRVERCVGPSADPTAIACPMGRLVRLSWFRDFRPSSQPGADRARPTDQSLYPGRRWQFTVRLKRPHALLNPDAFDAELRALSDGVGATGYVRASRNPDWPNRTLATRSLAPGATLEALRTTMRDAILQALAGHRADAAGVVAALSIGDQSAIPGHWWDSFNRTGVGHLMSISGLHITMLAGMAGGVARRLLRHPLIGRRALLERWPADRLKWLVALAVAFAYSALAGWGIPAQRTCWMLAVAGLALLGGRSQSLVRVLALSAGIVTLFDPWAPMSAGFWLSFASVAAIIWHGSRQERGALSAPGGVAGQAAGYGTSLAGSASQYPAWRTRLAALLVEAGRTQWAATVSLLPLGALFFASFSLVGPLANAFAIPLVSIVITPLALLGTAVVLPFPGPGGWLLGLVCVATGWLLDALKPLAEPRLAIIVLATPAWWALAIASLSVAALLAPFRLPGKPAAVAGLLPLFAAGDPLPAPGTMLVSALDVGQGSAILVETPGGRLLFDTGPRYGPDLDAGARVILPWLRSRAIGRLDGVVVSHADDDHAGGSASLLAGLQVDWLASPLPDDHPLPAAAARHYRCWRGMAWQWGEARFEFLHPGPERTTSQRSSTNANSCVLRIASPAGSVLLTGDIEAAQEGFLLEKLGAAALRADLLVAPHHGSNGSSSMPFLRAVAPRLAIAQAGYRNRFGHPGAKAQVRYRAAGITLQRTDRDGAISVRLQGPGRPPAVVRQRLDVPRYWRVRVE